MTMPQKASEKTIKKLAIFIIGKEKKYYQKVEVTVIQIIVKEKHHTIDSDNRSLFVLVVNNICVYSVRCLLPEEKDLLAIVVDRHQ